MLKKLTHTFYLNTDTYIGLLKYQQQPKINSTFNQNDLHNNNNNNNMQIDALR